MAPAVEINESSGINTRILNINSGVTSNKKVTSDPSSESSKEDGRGNYCSMATTNSLRNAESSEFHGCVVHPKKSSDCNGDQQKGHPNEEMSTNDADIEEIFNTIGIGRWNTWFILLVCLCQASSPTMYYQSVFTNMPTNFRCENNYTMENQFNEYDNYCGELELVSINNTSMHKANDNMNMSHHYSDRLCLHYEYDKSLFNSTFAIEFNLVCDRAWLSQLFTLLTVIGSLLGNFFTGLSDTYGRAIVIKISSYTYVLGTLVIGFGPHVYIVLIGRFIVGFCYPFLSNASYALLMETTTTKYRGIIGLLVFLAYDISTILLGVTAYYIREWRTLHLLISFPIYLLPVVVMFIRESPRWLIQHGFYKETYSQLKYASIKNGSVLASEEIVIQAIQEKKSICSSDKMQSNENIELGLASVLKTLFASSKMTKITLLAPSLWFLMSLVYFGVTLNANNFTTNPFMYIAMQGSVSIPSNAFGSFVIKRFGNMKTYQVSSLIIGICMFIILFVPEYIIWPKFVLVGIAMLLLALIAADCFIISSELFPTVNRSVGSGLCSVAYFVGFFFASMINHYLVDDLAWGFNVVCGLCSIVAVFLGMILPETQGKPLCETVEDVDNRT